MRIARTIRVRAPLRASSTRTPSAKAQPARANTKRQSVGLKNKAAVKRNNKRTEPTNKQVPSVNVAENTSKPDDEITESLAFVASYTIVGMGIGLFVSGLILSTL